MKRIDLGDGCVVETPLMDVESAAAYLGVSPRTLRRAGDTVPRHRVFGGLRYVKSEIDAWVLANGEEAGK